MGQGPLDGLCVLDAASLYPAPLLAAMLGDLGAHVIKLEPPSGDPLRRMGPTRAGRSLLWAQVARNKRSITLDLEHARGRELFRELVTHVDVLVENFHIDTLERWGLTYRELSSVNPRLIMVSVTCYGRTGPYRDRPGNGSLAEAFSGQAHMTGEPEGPPLLASLALGDNATALSGMIGTLAACYARDARGGTGQHVDVSMFEAVLQNLGTLLGSYDPDETPPARMGSRVAHAVPRNVYATRDGRWVAVSAATPRLGARVRELIDQPDAQGDALDRALAEWIGERGTGEVLATLLREGVPIAPVNDLRQVLEDEHVRERGSVVQVEDPNLGSVAMLAPAPRLSATPGAIQSTGPELGAHNPEIYGSWLGLSPEQLARLRDEGVV